MSLAGQGAVAIWHDIAAEGRAEFYAWHGQEHMPERAGIPGFLHGWRFLAVSGQPEYFNRYETVSPARGFIEPFAAQCDALLRKTAMQGATQLPALAIYRLQNSRGVFPWSAG